MCCLPKKTENPNNNSRVMDHNKHFHKRKTYPSVKTPKTERKQNVRKPVEFVINIKVKMGVVSFETPALLDSRVQDCFINEEFAKAKGL